MTVASDAELEVVVEAEVLEVDTELEVLEVDTEVEVVDSNVPKGISAIPFPSHQSALGGVSLVASMTVLPPPPWPSQKCT